MLQKVSRRKLGKQMEEEKQTKPSTHGISLTEEWIWWVKGENAIAEFPWVPLDEVGERWQCSAMSLRYAKGVQPLWAEGGELKCPEHKISWNLVVWVGSWQHGRG